MNRKYKIVLLFLVILLLSKNEVLACELETYKFNYYEKNQLTEFDKIKIDGVDYKLSNSIFIDESMNIRIPMADVLTFMGFDIMWLPKNYMASYKKGDIWGNIYIKDGKYSFGDKYIYLKDLPILNNSKTYVTDKFFKEILNCHVFIDDTGSLNIFNCL